MSQAAGPPDGPHTRHTLNERAARALDGPVVTCSVRHDVRQRQTLALSTLVSFCLQPPPGGANLYRFLITSLFCSQAMALSGVGGCVGGGRWAEGSEAGGGAGGEWLVTKVCENSKHFTSHVVCLRAGARGPHSHNSRCPFLEPGADVTLASTFDWSKYFVSHGRRDRGKAVLALDWTTRA